MKGGQHTAAEDQDLQEHARIHLAARRRNAVRGVKANV